MTQWTLAEYRDFYDRPRAMVCTGREGTFYFLCPFDEATDEYAGHYEVYRLPALAESEVCASWFGLETRALVRLSDIPVQSFPFDSPNRRFLHYDSIAPALSLSGEPQRHDAT